MKVAVEVARSTRALVRGDPSNASTPNRIGHSKLLLLAALLCLVSGAYAGQTTTYSYTGTVQTYTVPNGVTSIIIDAAGGQGGGNENSGGKGARIQGTYAVTPGAVLNIVVGQQGLLQVGGNTQNSSGGGGGTFVYIDAQNLLLAAGGGGGKCNYSGSVAVGTSTDGLATANGGASFPDAGAAGGTAGNNGAAGKYSNVPCSGGGTGWLTSGTNPYDGKGIGDWTGGPGFCGGGGGGCGGVGGFGGGGGGGNHYGGGGGGGGFSGGGGGTDPTHGGGGGSFNSGTSQTNTSGFQIGDGYVTITENVIPVVVSALSVYPNPSFVDVSNAFSIYVSPSGLTITWDFGDGTTGTGTNPKHIYSAPGTYTVTATVTGSGDPVVQTLSLNVQAIEPGSTGTFTTTQSMFVTYGRIRTTKNQCLQLEGFIPVNKSPIVHSANSRVNSSNLAVTVTVNGLKRSFVLNKQGHATLSDSRFGIKPAAKNSSFGKFQFYANPKTLNLNLATDVGLDTSNRPKLAIIVVTISGSTYSTVIPLTYLPAKDPGYVLFGTPFDFLVK